jgi:competence protein ComEA
MWAAGLAFWLLFAYRLDSRSQPSEAIEARGPAGPMLSDSCAAAQGVAADSGASPADARAGPGGSEGCVKVNSADSAGLVALPGVGPVLASRIVEYRATHGAFGSADDLIKVKGIGPAKLAKMRTHICF